MREETETIDLEVLVGSSRRALMAAAHELKAPLSLMKLYASRLEDSSLPADKREQYGARMAFTIEQMLRLTGDLLEGYRWENGQLPLQPLNTSLVCEEVLHELSPAAKELGQRLVLKRPIHGGMALGHAPFLKNVLWNLTFNALKHTPAGSEVRLVGRKQAGNVHILVVDDGPGFGRAAARQFARDPHARLQPSNQRAEGGLGLAVASQLVRAMNGSLRLTPSPKGGRCLVSLPASRQMTLSL